MVGQGENPTAERGVFPAFQIEPKELAAGGRIRNAEELVPAQNRLAQGAVMGVKRLHIQLRHAFQRANHPAFLKAHAV